MIRVSSLFVKLIATSTASSRDKVSSIAILALKTFLHISLQYTLFTCLRDVHGLSCRPQPSGRNHLKNFPASPQLPSSSRPDLAALSYVPPINFNGSRMYSQYCHLTEPHSPCETLQRDQEPFHCGPRRQGRLMFPCNCDPRPLSTLHMTRLDCQC